MSNQVFVSYSHQDKNWLDRLTVALAPFVRRDEIVLWTDHKVAPGDRWQLEIERHLAESNVAVLLVSMNFLASQFILDHELPTVLAGAREGRITLAWVPVSASAYDITGLAEFQAVINPNRPLDQMTPGELNQALVRVASLIAGGRTMTDIGRAMHIVDQAYPDLADQASNRTRSGPAQPFRVQARNTGTTIAFEAPGNRVIEQITMEELANLPMDQHRLIQSLEQSMLNEYERWTELRPKSTVLSAAERKAYDDAGKKMCQELNHILDFVLGTLGKNLYDHYMGVRFSCDQLVNR